MTKHERLLGPYTGLEKKSYSDSPVTTEIKRLSDEIQRTVAEFKTKHERAIAGKADIHEVDRISAAVSNLDAKLTDEILEVKRAAIFAGSAASEMKSRELRDYATKFDFYLRKGGAAAGQELETAAPTVPELKALSTSVAADGGFLVTPEVDRQVHELATLVSPIRDIANVTQVGTGSVQLAVSTSNTETGWVGENDDRPDTATSELEMIEIRVGEIYAQPVATQQMLDDAFINVEQWLSSKVATAFAKQEGVAFVNGNGLLKPKGLLTYPIVADASLVWGSVGYIPTGASGAFVGPAVGPPLVQGGDVLYDVVGALKYDYRPNARWLMNRKTVAACRKLKNLNGDYIWQDCLIPGQPNMLCGFPVSEVEDMPDIPANSYSIAFGDFRQAYQVIDRVGIRVLRDPFTKKAVVKFYTTKRVGGAVINFEAFKLLRFAVS